MTAQSTQSTQSSSVTNDLYMLKFTDGTVYTDRRSNKSAWNYKAAIAIARNVARKTASSIIVTPLKFEVTDEPINNESAYDRILNYVDSLKGHSLTEALRTYNLPVGKDAVASKRERLIAHLLKNGR